MKDVILDAYRVISDPSATVAQILQAKDDSNKSSLKQTAFILHSEGSASSTETPPRTPVKTPPVALPPFPPGSDSALADLLKSWYMAGYHAAKFELSKR